ncbi:MAG: VOC family protein [Myxococcota bacterium]|nr:VOC family protein [Myxococcota bacterium]
MKLFVNVDVPSIADAARFYVAALGFRVGRTMGPDMIELLGLEVPIYLLEKPARSGAVPDTDAIARTYARHWTPVHMDIVVDAIEPAVARADAAGAVRESDITEHAYGRMALYSDPWGNGFCLLEMNARGYDAITTAPER